MQKKVIKSHDALYDPIADLKTWRAMPTRSINQLDPFLFLNHHGPQHYGPNNNGLPFGPHPHRGFETLTFVLQGDITHVDSVTGESVINKGGIQWMTAGSGLVHAEVSSDEFKKNGGMEEVIQLWLNLPSHLKMTAPKYIGLQKEEIPQIVLDESRVKMNLVSGEYHEQKGPVDSITDLFTSTIEMQESGTFTDQLPENQQLLFYVINGVVEVNGVMLKQHQLAQMSIEGHEIEVLAQQDSQLIYCYGTPFNEPIVAHGPFVMNTREEISQAIKDYQSGKLGTVNL